MAGKSTKFWTASWSPIIGCNPAMPCAKRCWALTMVRRMEAAGFKRDKAGELPKRESLAWLATCLDDETLTKWSGKHYLVEKWLDKPLHWRKPRVVATGWLGDMWREECEFRWRQKMVLTAESEDVHQYLFLTKNPERMASECNRLGSFQWGQHMWFGTTVTNQADADHRIPHLLRIPGKRWLILEPLLGPVDIWPEDSELLGGTFKPYDPSGIYWIVVGQGTGGYKPANPEWIQSVIDQAQAAGVPVWTKALPPGVEPVRQAPPEIAAILRQDKKIAAECARVGAEVE